MFEHFACRSHTHLAKECTVAAAAAVVVVVVVVVAAAVRKAKPSLGHG